MGTALLPDDLWTTIQPLLSSEPPKPKGGRPRVPDRAALTGILFVLKAGCPGRCCHVSWAAGAAVPAGGGYATGSGPVCGTGCTESSERVGRHRWVVERTLAWLGQYRRLVVRYERLAELHLPLLTFTCALIYWKRFRQYKPTVAALR